MYEQPEYAPPTSTYPQVPLSVPGSPSAPYPPASPYAPPASPYAQVPAYAQVPRSSRRRAVTVGAASVIALGAVAGVAFTAGYNVALGGRGSLSAQSVTLPPPTSGGYGPGGSSSGGYGSGGGSGSSGGATATSAQEVGVVDINTVLKYQSAAAAGTGMVLTSSGTVLTNNHVIDGATSISVTVVSTGAKYTAAVVGDNPTQDVAVLQLQNASGLQTAKLGDSNTVSVGQSVTGVGNAGGAGGTPVTAAGTVTALNQPITAADDSGQNVQHLTGMIETDAGIQAGDSGGPLYNSAGDVIGMDSAAAASGAQPTAYAIPIDHALQIAQQITSGQASSTVHLGYPAFLGVSIASDNVQGAAVTSALSGGPAEAAGIGQGDVITSVGGATIGSATDLRTVMLQHKPGQSVNVTWTDQSGQSHTASVTLATGPAL